MTRCCDLRPGVVEGFAAHLLVRSTGGGTWRLSGLTRAEVSDSGYSGQMASDSPARARNSVASTTTLVSGTPKAGHSLTTVSGPAGGSGHIQ